MSDHEREIVDGTVAEEAEPSPEAPAGLALAPRPPAERQVLMPLDPDQVVEGMRQYQRLLRDLLEPSDWQTHDKHGRPLDKPFLKKSGWRKISRAFNLSFEHVHNVVERDEHGKPVRAEVWIRAVAPNGQYGDGDGYCDRSEGRFQSSRGRQKLENDLRSTATTRAKNRAISDLVGMGEVSAEEIEASGEPPPAHGPGCRRELAGRASRALSWLLDGDVDAAERTWERIGETAGGYVPAVCAEAIVATARARRERRNGGAASGEAAAEQAASSDPAGDAPDGAGTGAEPRPAAQADAGAQTDGGGETQLEAAARERQTADAAVRLAGVLEQARRCRCGFPTVEALARLLHGGRGVEQLDATELDGLRAALEAAYAGDTGEQLLREALAQAAQQQDPAAAAETLRRWLETRARIRARRAA